ncbi:MAG: hypothetical protein AAGF06_01765 [Pseudomonadota bacterium]
MFTIFKLTLILLIMSLSQHALSQYRIVTRATLYSEPSTSAPVTERNVTPNTKVTIMNQRGGFSLVKTDRNGLGWIPNGKISNQAPRPTAVAQAKAAIAVVNNVADATSEQKTDQKQAVIQSIEQSLATNNIPSEPKTPKQKNIMTVPSSDPYDQPSEEVLIARLTQENRELRQQLETSKNYILQYNESTASEQLKKENKTLNAQMNDLKLENRRLNERNMQGSFIWSLIIFLLGVAIGYAIFKRFTAKHNDR